MKLPVSILCLLSLILAMPWPAAAVQFVEADVCVYGGTSGGVAAAVCAARLGKTVVLVNYNNHLGGMSSGGLGATDIGNANAIHGISREFYNRIAAKYNTGGPKFSWEPKVAEAVFNEMVQEAGVPVYLDQRLASVEMEGQRLRTITMESGDVFRAKMFIDCTYEGDLMALAGVSYTVGREPNSQYGETLSGVQKARANSHQIRNGVDPYVVPGDPASGLLPQVNPGPLAADGTGDSRVQAFCFRLCLTNKASNRLMIAQPPGYDDAQYELLFRHIEREIANNASFTGPFYSTHSMPNSKTDSNNSGGVSFDFIGGGSDEWAEASHAEREVIAKAHENWQRGLIWTLQNHPRVPANIRSAQAQWGLPLDEFLDTDHWPHQLYVREARRMISDYVMTQKDCQGTMVAPDSVGLAAYTMDSHNVQRHATGGQVKNEGDVQVGVPQPYPISYRSIVPAVGQCENLFVTFALSASHMGFGSCRMEPVLMITSQSAATAACQAIDDGLPVQQVSYPKLRAQLLADGQRLEWNTVTSTGEIVDNADSTGVTITGEWLASTATSGFQPPNYLHDNNAGKGAKSVRFQPTLPAAGEYRVYTRWPAHTNRASNVPVDVIHPGGTFSTTVNQQVNGGIWVDLGTYEFAAGSNADCAVVIRTDDTGTGSADVGYVIADAVRYVSTTEPTVVTLWAANGSAAEPLSASLPARTGLVNLGRTGLVEDPLTVDLVFGGTAEVGADYVRDPAGASVSFPAGAAVASLTITPLADLLAEGSETVSVSLAAAGDYQVGELNAAEVRIADRPFDAWRKTKFTEPQLADPEVSGDIADSDQDGLTTLGEFLAESNPTLPGMPPPAQLDVEDFGGMPHLTYTFTRAKAADVLAVPEVSGDLDLWNSGPEHVVEEVLADDGVTQTIRARDLTPLVTGRYIHLRQERTP